MQSAAPIFARMGPEHLSDAVALSHAEGWPHRREDWALILSGSRGIVALREDRVVGTALVTASGPVAMAGMILVEESHRGQGLGRRIMERAMTENAPEEWRLVATQAGLPLYFKLGFEPFGEVQQHQGVARAASGGVPVLWASAADLPVLADLDRKATGMGRGWMLEALLRDGRILILREHGDLVAFAALRPFGHGEIAGPVVARSEEEARALLATLLTLRVGRFLRVDIPDATGLGPFLADHGLPRVGGGVAMRRGRLDLDSGAHRCFALAAQSLG